MATGSYFYFLLGSPTGLVTNSQTILSDSHIFGSSTSNILSDSMLVNTGSVGILSTTYIFGSVSTTIESNAHIFANQISTQINTDSYIFPICSFNPFISKTDGETLQSIELRDEHSLGLGTLNKWFMSGIGSASQKDLSVNKFSTDNVKYAKHVRYVTGGSYQCIDFTNCFFVMIETGSTLNPTSWNINDCKLYRYAPGSYLYYGPTTTTLGSSRAKIIQSLFANQLLGSGTVGSGNLTGLRVSTNAFGDVGLQGYYTQFSFSNTSTFSESRTLFGSIEGTIGSMHVWSNYQNTSIGGGTSGGEVYLPEGSTYLNTAGTVYRIGSHLSGSGLDPGVQQKFIQIIGAVGGGDAFNVGGGTLWSVLLVPGSVIWGSTITPSVLNKFKETHGVPSFGSITDTDILDLNTCFIVSNDVGISGSVNVGIINTIGSYSSSTSRTNLLSFNSGSNLQILCEGILGSPLHGNTGSLCIKHTINRIGSTVTDYINGYGVFYG